MRVLLAAGFCVVLSVSRALGDGLISDQKTIFGLPTGTPQAFDFCDSSLAAKQLWPFAASIVRDVFPETRDRLDACFSSRENKYWEQTEPEVVVFTFNHGLGLR
ncbi:MAG: hypothetical protein AAF596_03240 [Planctomycetota bacterium]